MEFLQKRLIQWFKKEPILLVATVFAVLSMFVVHPSVEYIRYIDWKTLACLFCLMISVKGLEIEGLPAAISKTALVHLRNVRSLVYFLVFGVFLASMLITNDVALIAFVPITISILRMCGQEHQTAYVVVLQTVAANIGSSLTPVGNPQNLYIYSHYGMRIGVFISAIFPYVLGGAICLAVCCLFVKNGSPVQTDAPVRREVSKRKTAVYCVLFILAAMSVFGIIPYGIAMIIVVTVVLIADKKLFAEIDFSLLLTFAVIFIFVGNLSNIPEVEDFLQKQISGNVVPVSVLSCQFISNVPAAILLSKFTDDAGSLLIGVSIGGMGTLIASMASVISYKLFTNEYRKQTGRYLKIFGILNIFILLVLMALHWFYGLIG